MADKLIVPPCVDGTSNHDWDMGSYFAGVEYKEGPADVEHEHCRKQGCYVLRVGSTDFDAYPDTVAGANEAYANRKILYYGALSAYSVGAHMGRYGVHPEVEKARIANEKIAAKLKAGEDTPQ